MSVSSSMAKNTVWWHAFLCIWLQIMFRISTRKCTRMQYFEIKKLHPLPTPLCLDAFGTSISSSPLDPPPFPRWFLDKSNAVWRVKACCVVGRTCRRRKWHCEHTAALLRRWTIAFCTWSAPDRTPLFSFGHSHLDTDAMAIYWPTPARQGRAGRLRCYIRPSPWACVRAVT